MNLKRLLNFISKKAEVKLEEQSESEYYEDLFVKNSQWNTPNPNTEEVLRWEIIEEFAKFSKSNFTKDDTKEYLILDLGCGRGWLTNLLSKYGVIKGIEPVSGVIEHAKKMFPNINFVAGTSKDLLEGGENNKYNLIISSEVIEHVPDENKDDFVNDIYNLLDKDGFVILTTPRQEAQEEWHKYLSADQPVEDWISEHELESLLLKNNFKKIKIKRLAMSPPIAGTPKIEIYQLWLFQKV